MKDMEASNMLDEFTSSLRWFNQNQSKIVKDYGDLYVAIKDDKIIASDEKLKKVITKLKEKNIEPSRTFIKFVSKVKLVF